MIPGSPNVAFTRCVTTSHLNVNNYLQLSIGMQIRNLIIRNIVIGYIIQSINLVHKC